MTLHYKQHIFLCTNQKDNGKQCCNEAGAEPISQYLKQALMDKGLHGVGKVRVSTSGCLGRCRKGPCLVIYPEGVWYSYRNNADIDNIIESHLLNQQVVSELEIE